MRYSAIFTKAEALENSLAHLRGREHGDVVAECASFVHGMQRHGCADALSAYSGKCRDPIDTCNTSIQEQRGNCYRFVIQIANIVVPGMAFAKAKVQVGIVVALGNFR